MNQNAESINMLHGIYQSASMGVEASRLLISKTENQQFSEKLRSYSDRYKEIKEEAAELLAQRREFPREPASSDKAGLWMGVQMNTLTDQSPSHLAEMLIQGSTMGIIKEVKHKNTHPQADHQCYELEDKYLSLQQEHIDDMKQFLN